MTHIAFRLHATLTVRGQPDLRVDTIIHVPSGQALAFAAKHPDAKIVATQTVG